MAAIVVAGAGIPVIKHVVAAPPLRCAGRRISLPSWAFRSICDEHVARCVTEAGIGFCFSFIAQRGVGSAQLVECVLELGASTSSWSSTRSATALTFDDVLLEPRDSSVHPNEVSLTTRLAAAIELSLPFVSSPMHTVTEHRTAICMAQKGGIHPQNISIEQEAAGIRPRQAFGAGHRHRPGHA